MKRVLLGATALIMAMGSVGASTAFAAPGDDRGYHGRSDRDGRWDGRNHRDNRWDGRYGRWGQNRWDHDRSWRNDKYYHHRWNRGQYIPRSYWGRYPVVEYRHYGLRAPPRGYHYVRSDRGDLLLAGIATGLIVGVIAAGR